VLAAPEQDSLLLSLEERSIIMTANQ
jgi:hypothetical protein